MVYLKILLFFFYWPKWDYLLVVDIGQDASQDLQQEDTQQQDKVLWTQGTLGGGKETQLVHLDAMK